MSDRAPEQRDRPDAPAFVSHVEGSSRMPEFPTAQAMADAYGAPVLVPAWWPDGVEPHYGVEFPHAGSSYPPTSYRIWWRDDERALRGLIIGSTARYPQEAGVGGWVGVPELASTAGIADSSGGTLLLDTAGQSLMFLTFSSFDDAVATASSLRWVDPGT